MGIDFKDIAIKDQGLARYINLERKTKSQGKHSSKIFGRSKVNLIERLTNDMMRSEKYTGKKTKAERVVAKALEEVQKKTKRNAIQVLVEALENVAPKEEVTTLKYGGISVPRSVDIAPQRRLDIALRLISKGACKSSFKNSKPIWECLSDGIINASLDEMSSWAIQKKEEIERIARSAR
jgi:small subunit ribosomal protein S7